MDYCMTHVMITRSQALKLSVVILCIVILVFSVSNSQALRRDSRLLRLKLSVKILVFSVSATATTNSQFFSVSQTRSCATTCFYFGSISIKSAIADTSRTAGLGCCSIIVTQTASMCTDGIGTTQYLHMHSFPILFIVLQMFDEMLKCHMLEDSDTYLQYSHGN